ncbi:TonB-dependent receptor [Novosphingobium sp. KACC 22771]|uniref:TonB-dependent receptor n=1 Tax=Novosphingobium sp. KACC 22771 TaxID=3025670 RepID=UPI00236514C8|nr:TonB-dependent receptor [Novosphingobium sp. KACC 22771]WDF74497.1 TonB-dependent receptor [Novosphingobium sp. KACC 22771]
MKSQKSLACSTAIIALMSHGTASAQTAAQPAAQSAAQPATADIVVTGMRASLERAQAVKQKSAGVIEALSSEDIGKLPQSSVADSLGRLAGLAGERRAGRVSGISVRGFREDFVGTTMNGRELIGIGDNRGVEYDLYPSEIIDTAVVYKTPNADLTAMGVGGTVDMRTIHPLEHKRTLVVNGTFEQNGQKSKNPDFKDQGYRVALSFSDKFANDTIGIALTAATTSSPTQDQYFSVWGYDKGAVSSGANAGKYAPAGIDISSRSRLLKRDTLAGVIEFKPAENFTAMVDALYINFSDQGISRGFVEALPIASDGSTVLSANASAITSARTTGFNSVLRTDPLDKRGKLKSFGGNLKYDPASDLHLSLDVAHSESTKRDTRAESYAGLGRAGLTTQGPNNIRTYNYGDNGLTFSNNAQAYDNYNTVRLAGPQSWGGSLSPITALNQTAVIGAGGQPIGFAQAQDGFLNTAIFDENLDSLRFAVQKDFEDSLIKHVNLGVRYSDHKKSKVNQGYFLTASTYPLDGAIPTSARRGVADLNWVGLGNVVAYDALGLINSNFYTRYDAASLEPDRMGDTYTIREKVWQPFIKADFEKEFGGIRMFGNAGLQGVITNQRASGFNSLVGANQLVNATPVSGGANYARVLPSVNLNFDLGSGHTVRFAASKVISRPRIDYLNPGSSVKFRNNVANVTNTDPGLGPWVSTSGNAQLRPYEANQFDASYEYYFARDGFISISAYYKDLVNWNVATTTVRDYTQFYIPGYHQAVSSDGSTIYTPATFKGLNTTYTGGLKGQVKGIEIQASLPFGRFVRALDGFGIVGGAAFTDGGLKDGTDVPGLSKRVFQITGFFEKGGFSARASLNNRSKWLSEDRGGSNTISPVNRAAQTLVDAQIGFDFKRTNIAYLKGLRISAQAQNLTNQKDVYTDTASGLVTRVETFGRNFLLNLTYSFF